MDLEDELRQETKKWLRKIEKKDVSLTDDENSEHIIENIKAYREDAKHFLEEGDLIEAFEAVIWAWSWMEIGEELGLVQ